MKTKEKQNRKEKEETSLSRHERDQLQTWLKASPRQRLAWLEEAQLLAASRNLSDRSY